MKDTFTLQQKTKLLSKLFDSGINTEKKLQQLDMERILKISGITIPEMNLIIELPVSYTHLTLPTNSLV